MKVGDKVRLSAKGRNDFYDGYSNPHYGSGFIVEKRDIEEGGMPWRVRWGDDVYNVYDSEHLEVIHAARTIELGKQYTSANGDRWECIAVRGDVAWMAGVDHDGMAGAAYRWKLDGEPICLGGHPDQYRIVFEHERKTVTCKANFSYGYIFGGRVSTGVGQNINITFDTLDGTPDWSTAKITPCE